MRNLWTAENSYVNSHISEDASFPLALPDSQSIEMNPSMGNQPSDPYSRRIMARVGLKPVTEFSL